MEELEGELGAHQFDSIEDIQAFLDGWRVDRNHAPQEDFHGLSPSQVSGLLYTPFESPEVVEFPKRLAVTPDAPVLRLFDLLVEGIGEEGVKATTKGFLPRKVCRHVVEQYWSAERDSKYLSPSPNARELDLPSLHVTRVVAELAGLVRKYKGRFQLTRRCQGILARDGAAGIYPLLLKTHAHKFNWAFSDNYDDLPFIQAGWLFTLYLLHLHGAEWKPFRFYEDAFLQAFPSALEEMQPRKSLYPYRKPDDPWRNCYTLRSLHRFAEFLGLAETSKISSDKLDFRYQVRKRPLLDKAVKFRVP